MRESETMKAEKKRKTGMELGGTKAGVRRPGRQVVVRRKVDKKTTAWGRGSRAPVIGKGVYGSNDEIIADFFTLFKLYSENEKKNKRKTVRQALHLRREIRAKVRRSISEKVLAPVINMARKHRLSFQSLEIIVYAFYIEVMGKSYDLQLGKIAAYLSGGRDKMLLSKLRLFSPDSALQKSGLLIVEKRYSDTGIKLSARASEYFVEPRGKRRAARPGSGKALKAFKSPREIYDKLSGYVMGQEDAKKKISVAVFNHLQRISLPEKIKKGIKKSNILMLGPTGSGKTYICEILARILDVPFVACDATRYSETGYVGGDVDDMLRILWENAGRDKKEAEKGIIYIDEIDKIASCGVISGHNTNRDVSGASVQQELLRLLEGDMVDTYGYKASMRASFRFNISDVLFICGGAFTGIDGIISRRLKSAGGIGFRASVPDEDGNILGKLRISDIEEYGIIPELIGRLPVIAALSPLGREDLVRILTESRESIFGQYRTLLNSNGIRIKLGRDSAYNIADEALRRGYGARGLRQVMEEMLSPVLFENIGRPNPDRELKINVGELKQG